MTRQKVTGKGMADLRAALYRRASGLCDRCWVPQIDGEWHMHHRLMRSHGGGDTLENCVVLCWRCHNHVHANTGEAYADGWLVRSHNHPAAIPVRNPRGFALLPGIEWEDTQ